MAFNIIILAQGMQTRLPDLQMPKQLLPLPACGGVPILGRTLMQLSALLRKQGASVTVVCDQRIDINRLPHELMLWSCQLADPGNSSLKGISRYLNARTDIRDASTVVLLGDVVYSWMCLDWIFNRPAPITFAVSRDLTPSSGEVWGLSYTPEGAGYMGLALQAALERHPPAQVDATYQPGQLRKWLWALPTPGADVVVADYTMDVDLPAHIPLLDEVSKLAAADDKEHGLTW